MALIDLQDDTHHTVYLASPAKKCYLHLLNLLADIDPLVISVNFTLVLTLIL